MEALITGVKVVLQVWESKSRQNTVYVEVTFDSGLISRAWTRKTYRIILEDLVEFFGRPHFSPVIHKPEVTEFIHIWYIEPSTRVDFTEYFYENYYRISKIEFTVQ